MCVSLECQACGNIENRVVGRDGGRLVFVAEYPFRCHGERRADIGVVRRDERELDLREGRVQNPTAPLQWAIEIFYTSRTEEEARVSIPWFELSALDVREALANARKHSASLNIQSIQGGTSRCIFVRDKRDRKCNNGWCGLQARYGRELGYYVPACRYMNECTRLLRAAMTGKLESRGYWTLYPKIDLHYKEKKLLWCEFLSYGMCIRCLRTTEGLAKDRPFCLNCFHLTNRETNEKNGLLPTTIAEKEKEALRDSFKWLARITHFWTLDNGGTPCLNCGHTYESQPFHRGTHRALGYVWYFGRKITICEACLPIIHNNPHHPIRLGIHPSLAS